MSSERYEPDQYMAMSQQNTLNAMDDALNENVDKAMSMWNNLNPAGTLKH